MKKAVLTYVVHLSCFYIKNVYFRMKTQEYLPDND